MPSSFGIFYISKMKFATEDKQTSNERSLDSLTVHIGINANGILLKTTTAFDFFVLATTNENKFSIETVRK
jgi:hypothetical protein